MFKISVEPLLFLSSIGLGAFTITLQNYYLQVICHTKYYENETLHENCVLLNFTAEQEQVIQKTASLFTMIRIIIETGPPAIFSILWYGSWCDTFGSKFLMILSTMGNLVSGIVIYILYTFVGINQTPVTVLLTSVPIAIGGGIISSAVSVFTYLSRKTEASERSFRLGILQGAGLLGTTAGLFLGAELVKSWNYGILFLFAIGIHGTVLLYIFVVIGQDTESLEAQESENLSNSNSRVSKFQLCNTEEIKNGLVICFKSREGNERKWIIYLLILSAVRVISTIGPVNLFFLYSRYKFGWDLDEFTRFSTVDNFSLVIGILFGSFVLIKWCQIPELIVMFLVSLLYIASSFIWGFAEVGWLMYLGSVVSSVFGLHGVISRSILSQFIHKDEIGKVFSFFTVEESLLPLVAGPLYTWIYVESLETFIGLPFIITGCINIIGLILFGFFWNSYRHSTYYSQNGGYRVPIDLDPQIHNQSQIN